MKEVFSDEPVVKESDFASHAKHQESHSEVEHIQEDFDYKVACDHVIPTKIVDRVMFVDGNEIKPVNVAMSSDVSDSIFKQETVNGSIEVSIVVENEKQPFDRSTK